MNKHLAEEANLLAIEFGLRLTRYLAKVGEQCGEEEFKGTARRVGHVLTAVFNNIQQPIYLELPELKPKQLGGSYDVPELPLLPSSDR